MYTIPSKMGKKLSKNMLAAPILPCGPSKALFSDLCGHFICLQGARINTPKGQMFSLHLERRQSKTHALKLHSGWGQCFFASVLFHNQLMKVALHYLWIELTTEATWLTVCTICCDRWRQIGDASWVFSTCPCSLLATRSTPNNLSLWYQEKNNNNSPCCYS